MEAIELRCSAGGGDHRAEENDVRSLLLHFIQHLRVVQAMGAAIEHGHLGCVLFSNEGGNLRME